MAIAIFGVQRYHRQRYSAAVIWLRPDAIKDENPSQAKIK
jgi:hypothetical protein